MEKKHGGPAFPVALENASSEPVDGFDFDKVPPGRGLQYAGMTLRDYFAAQAMANAYTHTVKKSTSQIAEWAYEIADAMISVREL